MSLKIYINRQPKNVAWGGGNAFVSAIFNIAPHHNVIVKSGHNVNDVTSSDIALIVGMDEDEDGFSAEQIISMKPLSDSKFKPIFRINENDARKATNNVDRRINRLRNFVSSDSFKGANVYVSDWLKSYFKDEQDNNPVIRNGVDKNIYAPSQLKDPSVVSIVAHHWSDNRMKGADVYEWIDQFVGKNNGYSFTYVGRTKSHLPNTKVIPPLFGKALGDAICGHDVYVSGTLYDPFPNHCLEAISCGLPTYVHANGGGAVEAAGYDHTFHSLFDLQMILLSNIFTQNSQTYITTWEDCVDKYMKFAYHLIR